MNSRPACQTGKALQPAEEKGQTDTPTLFDARSSLNNDEELIYDSLDHEERSIEAIAEATSLPVSKVASTLISLQLKNMVRQLPGNVFVRNKKR
ncbi:MAG: DprA-like winged helix domain-containing protein [Planctomycetota bacterium]